MGTPDLRQYTFTARLDCHYQVRVPPEPSDRTLLIVTLHGFASDPETMSRLTAMMFGDEHVVAALEGPNQFYLDVSAERVGCGWITRRHAPSAIRLHHEMVQHVLTEAGREYRIPPERRILVGFSQPVGLNYRFVATYSDAVRGVVGICGGLPSDWEEGPYGRVEASVLHIARRSDEIYPPAMTERFPERLGLRASDVEFHLLDGGHTFPSQGHSIAAGWLTRIFSVAG